MSQLHGPLETILPSYETMLQSIDKDFVSKIYVNKKDVTIQTNKTKPSDAHSTCKSDPTAARPDGCFSSNCPHNQPNQPFQ